MQATHSSVLFLEPLGGIAGDMFMAACLDLGVPVDVVREGLGALGPLGIRIDVRRDFEASIAGLHVDVVAEGPQPTERSYVDIVQMLDAAPLPFRVRDAAARVFEAIGKAEAHVHHKSLADIHFHEVGALDSIADIVGAALCLEHLGWPEIVHTPPPAGGGFGTTIHGVMPWPAPATLELMRGRRMRPSGPGERVTPTGAGLLVALGSEVASMPDLCIDKVGYGVGTKRWDDTPNIVRATLGHRPSGHRNDESQSLIFEVQCHVDDTSGQWIARAVERLFEVGALDAWVVPVVGKKGRPAQQIGVLVDAGTLEAVRTVLFEELPTLGVRWFPVAREVLSRDWISVDTQWGPVRIKRGFRGGQCVTRAPEHDDCLRLARAAQVPLRRVWAEAFERAMAGAGVAVAGLTPTDAESA